MFRLGSQKVSFGYVKVPLVYPKYEKVYLAMFEHPWFGQKWSFLCQKCGWCAQSDFGYVKPPLVGSNVDISVHVQTRVSKSVVWLCQNTLGLPQIRKTSFDYVETPLVGSKVEHLLWNMLGWRKSDFGYVSTCMDGSKVDICVHVQTWVSKHPLWLCKMTLG